MRIEERAEEPYRGITRHITMSTFNEVADRIPEIFGWLADRGVEPAGSPFLRYHAIDMENELEVEAGVPVPPNSAIPASDEDVTAGALPAGRYVVTEYTGHPEGLMQVTADLLAWAGQRGLEFDAHEDRWAGRVEFYLTNPAEEPDMTKWETQLAFKLKD